MKKAPDSKLRRIQWLILAAPIACALGMGIQCLLLFWQTNNGSNANAAINLSGRQRMLNQKHTSELLLLSVGQSADPESTFELMDESLAILREGGEHDFGTIPVPGVPELNAINHCADQMEQKQAIAHEFVAAVRNRDVKAVSELKTQLVEQTEATQQAADQVVTTISDASSQRDQRVASLMLTGSIFTAVVCTIIAILVSRRASRVIGRSAQSLESTSTAAKQMNTNAEVLRNAVEQFDASIQEIACNATKAASVAGNAVGAAGSTTDTISRLGQSSAEIGEMIRVINSIAEQTNLLALNATIEAARAGEAGKGFAVVANEVKELAAQTSQATEDIVRRIEAIQSDTLEATDAISLVSGIISQINESQSAIAGAVEEQTSMTAEISRNIADLADGSGEIAATMISLNELIHDNNRSNLNRVRDSFNERLAQKYSYENAC